MHYIETTDQPHHQDRIAAYSRLLAQHQDPVTAATQAFGDLGKLQTGLEAYIREQSFHYFRMPSPKTPDPASFQIATVSATDADARRAEFLAYNGRKTEAHALLDAVLKQDPNNAVACETLGYMALHDHDMEGAHKWLTRAVQLDSKSYLAHFYYAVMAMNADGLKDALAIESSLKTAIQLNPAYAPSYDRLAALYRMQHEHLQEAHMLEIHAVELEPSNISYRISMAYLMEEMNHEDDAVRVLNAAREFAKEPSQLAMIDAAVRQIQDTKGMRAAQAQAAQEAAAAALPEHPSASASASRHQVRGVIQGVRCGSGSVLELQVQNAEGKPIALYSNNYFKVEFSAVNEAPQGDMSPCKDLEGRNALVTYAETAVKTAGGEILSIQLGGAVTEHVAAAAAAPKLQARGVLHHVRCGPPAILELEIDGAKKMSLFANDYYKVNFLAMNYKPEGEIHPCSDLEGKHAIVLYSPVADDKTAAGQILSVALSR